jgi:hypothetical protein
MFRSWDGPVGDWVVRVAVGRAFGLLAAALGVGLSGLWGVANASTRAPGREPSPGQRPRIKGNHNHVADPRWVGIFVS